MIEEGEGEGGDEIFSFDLTINLMISRRSVAIEAIIIYVKIRAPV